MVARYKQIDIDVDVNRAIEEKRRSFNESPNDILRRMLLSGASSPAPPKQQSKPTRDAALPDAPKRARGLWAVEVKGQREPAANLKDAYRILLLRLSELAPNFLNDLAKVSARSRRLVARIPSDLYSASPHLAKDHAQLLTDGWYYDTNLSTAQTAKRARTAAQLCGLRYGRDVRIMNNLAEI